MSEMNTRNTKLVQYLNEAHAKEKELETSLEAHIGMTNRDAYKKRLTQHLKETKDHARQLERRIKKLGGSTAKMPQLASKGVALAKGPLHAMRGTSEEEKLLKNAKTRVLRGARGDRHLHRDRDPRRGGWRQGHGQARSGDSPRRGADGEVPRGPDPHAHQGRGEGRDPFRGAADPLPEAAQRQAWRPVRVALEQPVAVGQVELEGALAQLGFATDRARRGVSGAL